MSFRAKIGCACCALTLLLSFPGVARASATLLLEEPYGKLGFFTATGHAAVYLSGVCAETPLTLRPCAPGELGAVVSRYNGVSGYDWIAIPLIPYLYAVERPDEIPLFVDPKLVSFLRDQYRRQNLENIVTDATNGAKPGGNWYELIGTAYDRTVYGYQIETSSTQDLAFIAKYNSAPNRSHFRTVSRNCADFAKDVMNFYYPKALHRSVVADLGITTPKQMAKTLDKFESRHPEINLARFVIPQVPGTEARSSPVHGVVESFFKSKKYIVPSAVVSPIFAGCVAAVYLGSGAGHFDPARQALVFNAERNLEPPLGSEDRRAFQLELSHLSAASAAESGLHVEKWERLLRNATPDLDIAGRLILRVRTGGEVFNVGVTGGNILANENTAPFTQQLLDARLHAELRRGGPPIVSETDVEHDMALLRKARASREENGAVAQFHGSLLNGSMLNGLLPNGSPAHASNRP